jgi:hypothetical protein
MAGKRKSPVASANRRKRRTKACCAPGKNRARVCVGDLGKLQGPSSEARDRERLKSRNIQGAIVFGVYGGGTVLGSILASCPRSIVLLVDISFRQRANLKPRCPSTGSEWSVLTPKRQGSAPGLAVAISPWGRKEAPSRTGQSRLACGASWPLVNRCLHVPCSSPLRLLLVPLSGATLGVADRRHA